jgi:hypothetical protein
MDKLTIAFAAVGIWLALGVVFMSMCRAASHADREIESALRPATSPRTLKQHLFAIHVRSVRSMRRLGGQRGASQARPVAREHSRHSDLHSAHSA